MPGRRSVKSHENEAVPTQFSEGARGLRGWGASARFRARVYGALSVASEIGGADHTLVSAPGGEETRLPLIVTRPVTVRAEVRFHLQLSVFTQRPLSTWVSITLVKYG